MIGSPGLGYMEVYEHWLLLDGKQGTYYHYGLLNTLGPLLLLGRGILFANLVHMGPRGGASRAASSSLY